MKKCDECYTEYIGEKCPNCSSNNKKQKKIQLLLGGLITILIIMITCFILFVVKTPKMVFSGFINNLDFNMFGEEKISTFKGKLELSTNISNSNFISPVINNADFTIDYSFDFDNKYMDIELNTDYKNEDLLGVNIVGKDNAVYLLAEEYYDKYIKLVDIDLDNMVNSNINEGNYSLVIERIKAALTKSLKSKYFTNRKVDLEINNRKEEVNSSSLILNENNIREILNSVYGTLKSDEEFINELGLILGKSNSEVKIMLTDNYVHKSDMTLTIYTKGFSSEFVGLSLSETNSDNSLLIKKENNNKYTFNVDFEDSISGDILFDESSVKISLISPNVSDIGEVTLDFKLSYEYNKVVSQKKIIDSIYYTELSLEDYNNIMTKIQNKDSVVNLMLDLGLIGEE